MHPWGADLPLYNPVCTQELSCFHIPAPTQAVYDHRKSVAKSCFLSVCTHPRDGDLCPTIYDVILSSPALTVQTWPVSIAWARVYIMSLLWLLRLAQFRTSGGSLRIVSFVSIILQRLALLVNGRLRVSIMKWPPACVHLYVTADCLPQSPALLAVNMIMLVYVFVA